MKITGLHGAIASSGGVSEADVVTLINSSQAISSTEIDSDIALDADSDGFYVATGIADIEIDLTLMPVGTDVIIKRMMPDNAGVLRMWIDPESALTFARGETEVFFTAQGDVATFHRIGNVISRR